jgi:glycerol-3-phosphate cytidylyltransferase-like family protein
MRKVLITGANSFVGTNIEKWLMKTPEDFQVDTVDTMNDVWRQADFTKYDTVFHVAGIAHVDPKPEMAPLYYKVNRDLTIDIAKHAKEKGDFLIVAVQDGGYIQKYKPNAKIINTTDERRMMVASIRFVDEVVTYKDVDKDIVNLDFDVFAIGPDQNHEGFQKAIEWCKANGKEVMVIPRTEGISSSLLREFINIR